MLKLPDTSNLSNDKFYVYIDYKPDGTPFYIGISLGVNRIRNISRNIIHERICNKYENCYRRVEIEKETREEICNEEIRLITEYGTIRNVKGIKSGILSNMTSGGDTGCLGYRHTEQSKDIIRNKLKGKRSEETIKRIKLNHKGMSGKTHLEETKRKMSESKKGNKNSLSSKRTLEQIELMSEAKLGTLNPNSKGVIICSNGKRFESTRHAARETGFSQCMIAKACRNSDSYKDLYWWYE